MKNELERLFIDETSNGYIQFFRYLFVGGLAFIVDFGLLWLLTELLSVHYILSATISFIVGLVTNYLLSVRWIFRKSRHSNKVTEFTIYSVIGVVGLLLNDALLYLFTDVIGVHYLVSKLIATVLVMMWNFLGRKLILFNS